MKELTEVLTRKKFGIMTRIFEEKSKTVLIDWLIYLGEKAKICHFLHNWTKLGVVRECSALYEDNFAQGCGA